MSCRFSASFMMCFHVLRINLKFEARLPNFLRSVSSRSMRRSGLYSLTTYCVCPLCIFPRSMSSRSMHHLLCISRSEKYSRGEIRCRTPFGNCHQKESFSPLPSSIGDLCMDKMFYYTFNDMGLLHRKNQCSGSCTTAYLVKLNSSCLRCAYISD
jgi:hypothetical protein